MNERVDSKYPVISLLTGGQDVHYALGLLSGLIEHPLKVEFIGNDRWENSSITKAANVRYFNLRGNQDPQAPIVSKILRIVRYYGKLLLYAAQTKSKLFHILWLNKFTYFDRIILNLYYRVLGKKIVFTAHDINYRKLVGHDSFLNRLSLFLMYRIVHHIVVHTDKMKIELVNSYRVDKNRISVIPFGINEIMPKTELNGEAARCKLNIGTSDKVLLFFGNIAPYKGLEFLVNSLVLLKDKCEGLKLIIAGRIKVACQKYWQAIEKSIKENNLEKAIIKKIEYIPEEEAEVYFKAADLLILPYRNIFQSGLIFTSYHFGLPVIATDVGSLRDDIISETGFICKPENPEDLAEKIAQYYSSDLYKNLPETRKRIIDHGKKHHSWQLTGQMTFNLYNSLLNK